MKKYISLILVYCLLINFFGCYTMQDVTQDELTNQSETKSIYLWTQKHEYSFQGTDYSIENDTIIGHGKTGLKSSISHQNLVEEFNGKIPLSDVKKIELEKFNLVRTLFAIVIPIAIIYALSTVEIFPSGFHALGGARW